MLASTRADRRSARKRPAKPPAQQALDGLAGIDAGERRGVGVDRIDQGDALAPGDAARRAGIGEIGVGRMDDVVVPHHPGNTRVPGRQIGIVGNIGEEGKPAGAEAGRLQDIAQILRDRPALLLLPVEVKGEIEAASVIQGGGADPVPELGMAAGMAVERQVDQDADPQGALLRHPLLALCNPRSGSPRGNARLGRGRRHFIHADRTI